MAAHKSTSKPTVHAYTLAADGDIDGLKQLPREALAELDEHGSSAVHWAASCGQLEALQWLVESAGEDPESVGKTSARAKRRRPLHWAARNGQLDCVRYLVEGARVDPDPRDKQSVSPFQLAVWQNYADVARYLVEVAGVDARAVLFAILKGRSSAPTLRRPLRAIAAHVLAGNLLIYPFWVPTEHNPADGPSRGKRRRPVIKRF